jgi:hypothetical protein
MLSVFYKFSKFVTIKTTARFPFNLYLAFKFYTMGISHVVDSRKILGKSSGFFNCENCRQFQKNNYAKWLVRLPNYKITYNTLSCVLKATVHNRQRLYSSI